MPRTDGDSWDLASSVGATATMVAAQRALGHDLGLIDDPFAEPLVRAVGMEFFDRLLDGRLADDAAAAGLPDSMSPPRLAQSMAVRTRFFDAAFLDAAAGGVQQAVILAAGLDSRAYRLAWPAGTVVYELDRSEVIAFKTATLDGLGAQPRATHRTVAVDLRDDWPAALAAAGFDAAAPTAWSAEGLLVYLPAAAQDALFDDITALSAPGSVLATEYFPRADFFSERAAQLSERMRALNVPIDFADLVYREERTDVVDYLSAAGWRAEGHDLEALYAANGFDFADDDEMAAAFADLTYVRARL